MIKKDAIDAALTAHAQWKNRLLEAIKTGQSEFNADIVKKDNACLFGQWLYKLSPEDILSEHYSKVKKLHAEFHETAADILKLALEGKKNEALKKLEPGGGYGSISGKLVLALNSWKDSMN
jgi:hypothetical protein